MRKILLPIALFLFIGTTGWAQKLLVDEVIAVVGSKPILLSSVEAQFMQQQAQGYRGGVQTKCDLFEGMLFQKLLLAQAELDSIMVTEAEVESNLEMRLEDYIRQAGSREALERYFKKTLIEIKDEFRTTIEDQMITQRMQGEITKGIAVTPQDVNDFFKTIPKDSLPMVDGQYEIQQILKRPPINSKEKDEATQKLEKLRERIIGGESFSTLAILYSQDPGSANNGGELGFVGRATLDVAFANAAFNLKEGQVSRVIESQFGFHIIQMIARKEEQVNVRHILIIPKTTAEDKVKARVELDSVAKRIVKGEITFEQAALEASDDVDTKKNGGLMVNRYSGDSRFETKHISPEINYALRSMKVGDISQPFEAKDERDREVYLLIKLKSKTPPHVANLKDDYQSIQEIALNFRKDEQVQTWMKEKIAKTSVTINSDWRGCKLHNAEWVQ